MLLESSIIVLLKWTTACTFVHCSVISLQLDWRCLLAQCEFSIGCHNHINNWILSVNIINPIHCFSNVRVVDFVKYIFIFSLVTLDFLIMWNRVLLFLWLCMLQFCSCYLDDFFSNPYVFIDSPTPPFRSKKEAINVKMLIPLGCLLLPVSKFSIATVPAPPWLTCVLNTWIISAAMLLE